MKKLLSVVLVISLLLGFIPINAEGPRTNAESTNAWQMEIPETLNVDRNYIEENKETLFSGENVIDDPVLKDAINAAYKREGDRLKLSVTKEMLKHLLVLSPEKCLPHNPGEDFHKAKSLEGIQYAENLEYVSLPYQPITDFTPLANLTNIKFINITGASGVDDFSFFNNLTNLKEIHIRMVKIKDISSFKNFHDLEYLDADACEISDFSPLSELTKLKYLNLDKNNFKKDSAKQFEKLTNLEFLNINNKRDNYTFSIFPEKIDDISCLAGLTKLKEFQATGHAIKDISALANKNDLKVVYLNNNKIRDFSPIENVTDVYGKNDQIIPKESEEFTPKLKTIEVNLNDKITAELIKPAILNLPKNATLELVNRSVVADTSKVGSTKQQVKIIFSDKSYKFVTVILNVIEKTSDENEYINIPDSKFLKVINKNLDPNRPDDQKVTKAEMETLETISHWIDENGKPGIKDNAKKSILGTPKSLEGTDEYKFMVSYGIKSIEGIKYAKNLKRLKLNENEISDISELSDLTKLEYLEFSRNRLTDISPLKNLTNLTFLKLYNNWIEDVSPIAGLTNLTDLDIHNNVRQKLVDGKRVNSNGIVDVSPLKNLTKLRFLDLSTNSIKDASVILNFPDLKDLDLSGNHIETYVGLGENIAKRFVNVGSGIGSQNFWAQSVKVEKAVEVDGNEVTIDNPYKGFDELFTSLLNATAEEPQDKETPLMSAQQYTEVSTETDGVEVEYDLKENKLKFKLSNIFLAQNKGKTISVPLTYSFLGAYAWNAEITLNISDSIDVNVAEGEIAKFYKKLFNKYSKSDKMYPNLTEDGNKLVNAKSPLIKGDVIKPEDMKYLKTFTVTDRDVDDSLVEPLKLATHLKEFKVEHNNENLKRDIKDFSFIKNCPELEVFIYQNQFLNGKSSKDISKQFAMRLFEPLKALENLKHININSVRLMNLNSFKGLDLDILSVQEDEINNISALSDIKVADRLDLDNNKIKDISALNGKDKIVTLYLLGNPIKDITPLKTMKSLEALHLRNTEISDISLLKELPNLHRLYVDKCKNLVDNYMDTIKELKGLNTLYVSDINLEDFEWMKKFAIRDAVEAKYGEDKVRLFGFDNLKYDLEVNKSDIVDNKITIENPLKDWDNNFISQDDQNGINKNLEFKDDKIIVSVEDINNINEKYNIYIQNYEHGYGDYNQPAEISGTITLSIKVIPDELKVNFEIKDEDHNKGEFVKNEAGGVNNILVLPYKFDFENLKKQAPKINAKKGYKFIGWDKEFSGKLTENTTFTALFEKIPLKPYVPVEPSYPVLPIEVETPDFSFRGHGKAMTDLSSNKTEEVPVKKVETKEEKKAEVAPTHEAKDYGIVKTVPTTPVNLTDIPQNETGTAITNMVSRGILKGMDNGKFEGKLSINRAMVATVLMRISKDKTTTSSNFTDVKSTDWFKDAVNWAAKHGYVKGYEDGSFNANKKVTRQEFALILYRFLLDKGIKLENVKNSTPNLDGVAPWAKEAVEALSNAGIVNGKEFTNYDANGEFTREELAITLDKIIKIVEK